MNAIAALLLAALVTRAPAAEKPNVMFIAVDDLRDWVGFLDGYGGKVHTPNLDRLADGDFIAFTMPNLRLSWNAVVVPFWPEPFPLRSSATLRSPICFPKSENL